MREQIKFLLTRMPALYTRILRLKKRKEYDNERIVFLTAVRDGDVVFDIGANRGTYTLFLSNIVGPKGEIHAFEPVPPTFAMLSENVSKRRRFDNIKLNNSAAGESAGTITINMPDCDDGQASMARHAAGSWKEAKTISTFQCHVTTLDAYAASVPRAPAFVKCDVEGAELLALRGGKEMFTRHTPILMLEICKDWTRNFGYAPLDVYHFARSLGYDIFYLIDETIRLLENPESELQESKLGASADLLCGVSRSHQERLKGLSFS